MRFPRLAPNRLLAAVLVVAAGVAAALIAVSLTGSKAKTAAPTAVAGGAETSRLLAGTRQSGNVLGSSRAPLAVVEYADLQCPYCAAWARDTFPLLVREYVRPGKVKLVFRGLAFIGPDSETALRAALAAGAQDRLWNVVELLYRNQGEEGSGWVTDGLLRSIGGAVPGLDVGRMMSARSSPAVDSAMAAAATAAQEAGVSSTPTFEIGRAGQPATQLRGALPPAAFRQVLDSLLET